jgi:Spy/CpxP family protein refolding chaperone
MMKLKLVPMFTGVIAAGAIAATPLVAFAQTQQPQPTQSQPAQTRIELTPDQKTQFEAIQTKAITEIEKILTPAQKTQYSTAREGGQGVIQGLGAIENISDTQKNQIMAILQTANSEIENMLTPEQKQQIQQIQSN